MSTALTHMPHAHAMRGPPPATPRVSCRRTHRRCLRPRRRPLPVWVGAYAAEAGACVILSRSLKARLAGCGDADDNNLSEIFAALPRTEPKSRVFLSNLQWVRGRSRRVRAAMAGANDSWSRLGPLSINSTPTTTTWCR